MNDMQKWLDVVNQNTDRQTLMEDSQLKVERGMLREFVDGSVEDDLDAWINDNPGILDALKNILGREDQRQREANKKEALREFIELAQEVFDIDIDDKKSKIEEVGKTGARIELAVKGKLDKQSVSGFVAAIEESIPNTTVTGAQIKGKTIVVEIDIDMPESTNEENSLREALSAKLREFMEDSDQPAGSRYDYEVTAEGGVILRDLHSGRDGYLQPGDDAGQFFDDLDDWESAGNEFNDEFVTSHGFQDVIDSGESVSEDQGAQAGYLLRGAAVEPYKFFVNRKDRGYELDQQRENWTRDPKQATVYASAEEAAAATKNMRQAYSIVATDNPNGTPVAQAVNGHLQDYKTHESQKPNGRETTRSVEHRDPKGRFTVEYDYDQKKYTVVPSPDYKGLIEPGVFDNASDAQEHAERELEGAGEGLDEESSATDQNMDDLKQQALIAAHPFGGSAQKFQEPVIRKLEDEGLVEVVSYEPTDGSLNYVLTDAGQAEVQRLRSKEPSSEDIDEIKRLSGL